MLVDSHCHLDLEHFDKELCWANCVWYAHTDSQMKVEDIGLCSNCGYCKPNNSSDGIKNYVVLESQLGVRVYELDTEDTE